MTNPSNIAAALSIWALAVSSEPGHSIVSAPKTVEFKVKSVDGRGCPSDADMQVLSSSISDLTLELPSLKVEYSPSGESKKPKSYCRIKLNIAYQGKFQFAISNMSVHARPQLAEKSQAQLVTSYTHFSNGQTSGKTSFLSEGSSDKPIPVASELPTEWSSCGEHGDVDLIVGGGFVKDQNLEAKGKSTLEVLAPLGLSILWQPCKS